MEVCAYVEVCVWRCVCVEVCVCGGMCGGVCVEVCTATWIDHQASTGQEGHTLNSLRTV